MAAAGFKVFLDTSFIIDLMKDPGRFPSDPIMRTRIELVKEYFNALTKVGDTDLDPEFYVSAISLAEMMKINHPTPVAFVSEALKGRDMHIVDFTRKTAEVLHTKLSASLPQGKKFEFIKNLKDRLSLDNIPSPHNVVVDDMKICASACTIKGLNKVLTSDINTFLPVAEAFGLPVVSMEPAKIIRNLLHEIDIYV